MTKWIIVGIFVSGVVGMWWYTRTYVQYEAEWQKPKMAEIVRGSIRVPVTAPGRIEPAQRIEIKSKASGEVIEIHVEAGDSVERGDVLVSLKPDDEERALAQAQAALKRAKALLSQAIVNGLKAETNVAIAEARVKELEANLRIVTYDRDKEIDIWDDGKGPSSEQAVVRLRRQVEITEAQLASARANVAIARHNIEDAKQTVVIQQAAVDEAEKAVEDAQERLDETTIVAPQNAIVTRVDVSVGNLVQSATRGLVGGTAVMELADISALKVVARVDEADYGRVLNIAPIAALPEIAELRAAAEREALNVAPRGSVRLAADTEEVDEQTEAALHNAVDRDGIVRLSVDAFPEDSFTGKIVRVEPQGALNPGASIIQFDVHVAVTDERRYKLPLGTQAQVEFTVEQVEDALLVPAEAVKTLDEQRGLYVEVPVPPGSSEKYGKKFVPCRFGITDGANTQAIPLVSTDELKEGQKVYTKLPGD